MPKKVKVYKEVCHKFIMTDDGKPTNKSDDTGKGDNSNPTDSGDDTETNIQINSPLDEAKEINKKKEELLEREEKLITRKEKLHAEQMVGGQTQAGQTENPKEETPKEYRDRIDKETNEGKHDE